MQFASKAEASAVPEAAQGGQFGSVASVPRQVATEPRLALGEERPDLALGVQPAATAGWRNGDDHPTIGMNHDPKATGTW